MIGGKSNSVMRPTALGTLLNASTYGATIPTIYGMTRSNLLVIWAANLRLGPSGKKGKGSLASALGSGTLPTYVENCDFLIGSNPIEFVGQTWWNNTGRATLTIVRLATAIPFSGFSVLPVTIADPHFYAVIGVTAEVSLEGTFNDFGAQGFGFSATVSDSLASTYLVGDTFSVDGSSTSDPAIAEVVGVDVFGRVTQVKWLYFGSGYVASGVFHTTTTLTGTGSGATVRINSLGTGGYSGLYEMPLWNVVQHGPDLINAGQSRNWPFVYKWAPGDGAVVHFPSSVVESDAGFPNGTGNVFIYYFQLKNVGGGHGFIPPITFNDLNFEQQLGSGTEYSDAGLAGQQIIYPFYAGLGSSEMDLGATGLLPQFRMETKGSNALYSTGDADFADMIEDTIKSGQLQVGAELGLIQRGVNCNELPGVVQKAQWQALEAFMLTILNYWQPIPKGTILIGMGLSRPRPGNVTIADTAGSSWNTVYQSASTCFGVFWAQAAAAIPAPDQVSFLYNGAGNFNNEGYILAMDPGSDTVEGSASVSGTGDGVTKETLSITTTGPAYLIAFFNSAYNSTTPPVPTHWNDLFPNVYSNATGGQNGRVFYRNVNSAGTYTITLPPMNVGVLWDLVLIAISQSEPSPLPVALGNIIDDPTMQTLRLQCRANGLYGSITMDSQRKASDWLGEFYKCANGAPVWSGFKLKSIARSEVSYAGNGAVYIATTAGGPVATLTQSDLIGDTSKPLITVARKAQVDANNVLQIEHIDRANDYNVTTASEPESGAIALRGPRKLAPQTLHEIQDPTIARKILGIEVRRYVMLRNIYKFTMMAKWIGLEAMDLIAINDPLLNIVNMPVRITSIKENNNFDLDVEAEPFFYGVHAPDPLLLSTSAAPTNPTSTYVPALVNNPIFIEPPGRMSSDSKPQLWFVVSDSDPLYGGAAIYVSTDGGVSYSPSPIGGTVGNATTGYVTSDWPAAADPDSVNTLYVDLSESRGSLADYTTAQRDEFIFPCYVSPTPSPTPVFDAALGNNNVDPSPSVAIGNPAGDVGWFFAVTRGGQAGIWFLSKNDGCGGVIGCGGGVQMVLGNPAGCSACSDATKVVNIFPLETGITGSSPFSNPYNFSGEHVGITAPGGIRIIDFKFVPLPVGVASGSITLDEVTFNYTGAEMLLGGQGVFIVRMGGFIPGKPSLYLVALLGCLGGTITPGAGWTQNVDTTNAIPVWTQVGTAVESAYAYELMTYATANLTSHPYNYAIVPTTRRGVFGMPAAGVGVDHAIGTRFAWLNAWQSDPLPPGIFKADLDPSWIGKQLYFKFVQFNNLGGGLANIADAVPYIYTPQGLASGGGTIGGGTLPPGSPQVSYQITSGGALTQPTPTSIAMTAATVSFSNGAAVTYAPRTFTIPAPTVPTTYYVTIFDPNQLGEVGSTPSLSAQAQTSPSLVGVPGYIYIGSIVALPGGGGTVTSPGGFPGEEQILVNGL